MNAAAADKRRRDLAAIHVLAKKAGLIEETVDGRKDAGYKALLADVAGVQSAADLNAAQRREVLLRLGGNKPAAGGPQARLMRHIWKRLEAAGEVQSAAGLAAWVEANTRRDTRRGRGWERPEWVPPAVAGRLIEQLKKWADRCGVDWRAN